ncbi:MAG TPA: ATP-binding cassette domain-containing protein [Paracoccaceae bacterium]|nr:ATP-binding cassette domain-containing protein [Paracoccaceae bacterium]
MHGILPHVRLLELRFAFDGRAQGVLDIEALTIGAGERVAVIGASGAGKSTLLKLIDGRLFGWTGRAEVLGRALSPRRPPPRRWQADVGFVFQEFGLVDRATVHENVRIGRLGRADPVLSLFGRFTAEDEGAVEQAIRDVGLEELAGERVDRLSGGQRQRVGVARCLAQEPRILVADEPTSNLDPAGAEAILGLLRSCAQARGATLIVSSHQPKLIARFVERVIGLREGRVQFDRPASALRAEDLAGLYRWQVAQPAA